MLEFVNLTGADEKDGETRRKIRSQAMRDFRRRQREERKDNLKSNEKRPASVKRERSRSRASSRKSDRKLELVSGKRSPGCFPSTQTSDGDVPVPSAPRTPAMAFEGTFTEDRFSTSYAASFASSHTSLDTTFLHTPALLNEGSSRLSSSPPWTPDDGNDTFQTPAQISQVPTFCRSYVHWLQPGTSSAQVGEVLIDGWDTEPSPMLLAECCRASVEHLDAVQSSPPKCNYDFDKARVLGEVSERIKASDLAITDDTVSALGLLTSFEMSEGSGEYLTHLQGLRSLINTKGGIGAPDQSELSILLETLDLIHSVTFDSELVLTTGSSSIGMSPLAEDDLSDPAVATRLTPILLAEQKALHQTPTAHSDQLLLYPAVLTAGMVAAEHLLMAFRGPSSTSNGQRAIANFHHTLGLFEQSIHQGSPVSGDPSALARACYVEFVLVHNVAMLKLPYRHDAIQELAGQLLTAVHAVKDDAWQSVPYLRLKLLLTGAAAANDMSWRSYFKAQLMRAIRQMGHSEWRRVKMFVNRFLARKRVLELVDVSIPVTAIDTSNLDPGLFHFLACPKTSGFAYVPSTAGACQALQGYT